MHAVAGIERHAPPPSAPPPPSFKELRKIGWGEQMLDKRLRLRRKPRRVGEAKVSGTSRVWHMEVTHRGGPPAVCPLFVESHLRHHSPGGDQKHGF